MRNEKGWLVWGVLTAVILLFLYAIAANVHPALRGPDDWRWTYAIPGQPARHPVGAVAIMLYVVVVLKWGWQLLGREPSRQEIVGYLLFCALSVPVIQVALLAGESPDVVEQLYFRTISAGASGFFSVGSIIDNPGDFLAQYPALMPTFPVHPQRYPPGIPLLFYASRAPLAIGGLGEMLGGALRPYQCTDLTLMRIPNAVMGTAVLQMLLPLFSGLVIFPMFGLARRTLGWGTAVWSVALYPLVPSFALWAGRWDQFFPLLTVTAWYLLVVGITGQKRWLLLLSGVVLALASMLSFGLLVMLAPMGLWVLLWLVEHRVDWNGRQVAIAGICFVAGFVLVWGIYQVLAGPGFLQIWRVSMNYHLGLSRSYWTWLGYHLYDFGIFLGLPIALLALFSFFYALLTARRELVALPIAFGLSIVLLNISGTARGEVARVWIFLTPFAVMCAVWGLWRLAHGRWPITIIIILLATQLLIFNAFLRVVNTGITAIPPRVMVYERPPITNEINAQFGNDIHLLGYDLNRQTAAPDETIMVTLYWQTDGRLDTPYTVFNHLVNENGELVTQQDGMPVNNSLPTTCWQPGEIIIDAHTITLNPETPSGTYTLLTGLYHSDTGARLPVSDGNALLNDGVKLDTIVIEENEK